MSKRCINCPSSFALAGFILLFGVIFQPDARAQAGASLTSDTRKRMTQAVDKTLQAGQHGKLPPHISTLLGLSQEAEVPVAQGVLRTGKIVQGFDVAIANKNDVVLFVVNEATSDQTLYLTSKAGLLRKLVIVVEGEGRVQKITSKDRKDFEREKQFWLNRLAPVEAP